MRVALLYPPDFNRPTMIFGALPLFNACLKRAGHETQLIDVNAEAFSYFLRPGNIERYIELMDSTIAALQSKPDRSPIESAQLAGFRQLRVYPRDLLLESRDAAEGMRDPERFYQPRLYRRYDRVIRTTHAFLNSLTPQLDPRNNSYTESLYQYLAGETLDPYLEYYQNDLLPRLAEFKPDLVAMSCPFSPQVATGMYLARHARDSLPEARFLMGGTGASDTAELIFGDPRFYDHVDFGVDGDGEDALPDLCSAVSGTKSLDEVAGLWRRESDEVIKPRYRAEVDLDSTPTPDYRDVDFSHYMLPEKAGIYTTSRGCYYGKCTFCPESFRLGFRKRSPERVYDDVKNLVEEQGVKYLHFFDPLTPPVTLEHVSRKIARDELDFHWYAEVKFEKIYTNRDYVAKLSDGGCRQLQFGFESGVQRVLDRMKKGNKLPHLEIILKHLREFGISMVGTWFIGFPTETEEEALESWRFWRRHPAEMQLSLYTGTFSLGPEVPVFHQPEDYGVKIVYQEDGYARCVPLEGEDWDKEPMHTAFHVRSDIEVTICGAGLLYAAHYPERLYELRAVNVVGPTSYDEPPIAERRLAVSRECNIVALDPEFDGVGGYRGFVSESLRTFELDAGDVDLMKSIGFEPKPASEILKNGDAETSDRLVRLIDRGFLESGDPASENLDFPGRKTRTAALR